VRSPWIPDYSNDIQYCLHLSVQTLMIQIITYFTTQFWNYTNEVCLFTLSSQVLTFYCILDVAFLFYRLSTIIRYICTDISSIPAGKFPHIYNVVKGVILYSACSCFICDTITIVESLQVCLMDYIHLR
jgi:hypothetical protein